MSEAMTGALRSEWTKIVSVRSTYWTLIAAVVVGIGLSGLLAWSTVAFWDEMSEAERADFGPVSYSQFPTFFAQVAIVVFGVLAISSEYGTGAIRTSLAAVPGRIRFLAAKVTVVGVGALAVGLLVAFGSFFAAQPVYATEDLHTTIGEAGVVWALLRSAVGLALLALLALGVGVLLRHTAGSVTVMLAALYLPVTFGEMLPEWWQEHLIKYLPSTAFGVLPYPKSEIPQDWNITPLFGLVTLVVWTAVLLAAAGARLSHSDA